MILVLLFRGNLQPLLLELQTESSCMCEILISTRLENANLHPKMSILPFEISTNFGAFLLLLINFPPEVKTVKNQN